MSSCVPSRTDNPEDSLRSRVLARVRRSVELHREYTTVRRERAAWAVCTPGVAARRLREDATMRVELLRLDASAALPWPDDAQGQELLVLRGALEAPQDGEPVVLGPQDYAIRARDTGLVLQAGPDGAEVYVRQRRIDAARLPALEAHWWRLAAGRARLVLHARRRWSEVSPGVEALALWGDREVVSMLVRFAPGASVPDHHHALDEDCLVLDGEMFLGDILLRAGDYQLAPAGGGHWGETSDVGVLFFFHGALDPVLTRDSAGASRSPSGSAA
jgi:hypothetical protein